MKIVVLGGGISSERQVSIVTAVSVCRALRSIGHKAIFVDVFLGLENNLGDLDSLFDNENGLCPNEEINCEEPDISKVIGQRKDKSDTRIGKNVIDICKLADCVFIGLHGIDGEDGKIQACLDLLGIPYTGSDTLGSAIALDKEMARKIMSANSINVAPLTDKAPCVVKCIHGGSSIGTYICNTEQDMHIALKAVKEYQDSIIIEKKINGIELTVPILNGKALSPIEIVPPKSGKFDYIAKYQNGNEGAQEICPARISSEKTKEVQAIAERIHEAMKLSVYSRVDFIMDNDGELWCLEVNTLPGMTPNSLLPKAAAYAGIDYGQLCEMIIDLSMEKYRNRRM